ncbi:hypothetical protein KAR91_47995 [Candidatus Pacearchaeota archaeon]|nr:hypothetical protein [Candidatus Pacearchaeota archaeon]
MADRRPKVRELSKRLRRQHPDWPKHKCNAMAKNMVTYNQKGDKLNG